MSAGSFFRGTFAVTLLSRGTWAVIDQALFAVSNFVLNIALARWLAPVQYGAFSTSYAVFLLFGTLHGALIVEPMLVFGSGKYEARRASYLEVLLEGHWLFTGSAGAVLMIAGVALMAFDSTMLGKAVIAVGLFSPLILLQWLTRRICYMLLEPRTAALAGILYMLVVLVGVRMLFELEWLNSVSAVGLMGVASAVSSLYLLSQFRITSRLAGTATFRREVFAEHWTYGRWSVAASGLGWIPTNIYYVVIPAALGLAAAGALRAMTNLIMPVLHTFLALSILLIPVLVRTHGTPAWRQTVKQAIIFFLGAALVYWLLLGVLGGTIINLLYDGRYDQYASLLWIIGLIPISGAGIAVMGSILRARERPQDIFVAYFISACVALTVGLGLLFIGRIWGAVIGMALSSFTTGCAMIWLLRSNSISSDAWQWLSVFRTRQEIV